MAYEHKPETAVCKKLSNTEVVTYGLTLVDKAAEGM